METKKLLSDETLAALHQLAEEKQLDKNNKKSAKSAKTVKSAKTEKKVVQKTNAEMVNVPMKQIDLSKKSFSCSEITDEALSALIEKNRSFEITGLEAEGSMTQMIERLENIMTAQKKRCRVYTWGRAAAVAAAAIPTGVTQVTGAAAAVGIGLHNFATYNPDYEIAKHLIDNKLSINKKEVTMENGKPKTRMSFLADLTIAAAGALADGFVNAAEKGAKAQGRTAEFNQQKAEFNAAREKIGAGFKKMTGKDK